MSTSAFPTLVECLSDLPDPRVERTRLHSLMDILVIAICAILCGAEGWDDMAAFGVAKRDWLPERLELPNGIPSADTFRRVFARLQPSALQTCFRLWTQTLHQLTAGEIISLDGKVLRHSFDLACGQSAIHLISAWAGRARLVLGQVKIVEKTNAIPMVPALLRLLAITGCIVTTDAMSCQTARVAQIVQQEGDYVIAVKDNQKNLHHDIQARFAYAEEKLWRDMNHSCHTTSGRGHGRADIRRCDLLTLDLDDLCWGNAQQDGKAYAVSPVSPAPGKSATRAARKRVTSLAAYPTRQRKFSKPRGSTGALRTACTMSWMSALTKTPAASAQNMEPRIWLFCATSRST